MNENPKVEAATRDAKPPLDLLEHDADVQIALALLSGARKYGKQNYRTIPIYASTYGAAMKRHVGAFLNGEPRDPETGLSHWAMMGANVHIVLKAMADGNFVDDLGPQRRTVEQEARSAASNAQHAGRPAAADADARA